MDLISLKCFYAVVEHHSFSRAAEELFLTQSSVSKHVAALEKAWGFPLFTRTTRSVRPTAQGEILHLALREMGVIWEREFERASMVERSLEGHLRVGLLSGWVIERFTILETFQKRFPKVRLEIQKLNYYELSERISNGKLDVIFQTILEDEPAPDGPNVSSHHAFRVPLYFVLSPAHPAAAKAKSLCDLDGLESYANDLDTHPLALRRLEHHLKEWGMHMTAAPLPNHESILTAVDRGMGCTLSTTLFLPLGHPYKLFETGECWSVACAWNTENNKEIVEAFVGEVQRATPEKLAHFTV